MSPGNGFPGGCPGFYTAGGYGHRSTNNPPQTPFPSRSEIFIDPSSQFANRTSNLIGKRTLSEFQTQQQQNQLMSNIFLRSVTPRLYNQISPVSEVFLSGDPFLNKGRNGVVGLESEKKLMNRLQELEKQLLDDDEESDSVSVITNLNSEWSEAIQNLISPSPTSSSPSSSSVISSISGCSKQSLMEAASAISEGKTELVSEIVTRLTQFPNTKGNSEQRLTGYMISALKSRLNPVENPPPVAELSSKEDLVSTQLLYDLSPCFKLGFMAANLAIIEATLDCVKVHIIDFDIGQGVQYMNLLHALSSGQNVSPAAVRITAVNDLGNADEERLKSVGDMLNQVADRVGISFEFNIVTQSLTELTRDSLGCELDETIAVNFAFKLYRMPDESVSTENPRDELLRRVKGLSPRVVTLVEQEMNTNTAPFVARVGETYSYYGALFDSIDATIARDSNSDLVKAEDCLSRKLVNSVACEGSDRVERCEVFGKWRARMSMAGFTLKTPSQNAAESMRARLSSGNRVNPGFTVKEENGGVCFGWMGRTLTVASAWH